MATRSTCLASAVRISSVAGSPFASSTLDVQTLRGEAVFQTLEIGAVGFHLLGLAELEVVEMARREPVGHVHEQQLRARQACQLRDVRQDGLVGGRVFDRDQDAFVHRSTGILQRGERLPEQIDIQRGNHQRHGPG